MLSMPEPEDEPSGEPELGPAGLRLWDEISAVYALSPGETAILRQACRVADYIRWLDIELRDQPTTVATSTGPKANPLLGESANQRRVFDQLIRSLALPYPGESEGTRRSPEKVLAAQKRWRDERERRRG
jgi:hypothetical protein